MAFRDRETKTIPLGRYARLSVGVASVEGMDTKAPCPKGCDEDGKVNMDCDRCFGYGYVHKDGDRTVTIVAAEGKVNDWAAYGETRDASDMKNNFSSFAEAVHFYGVKLSRTDAAEVFPEWAARLEWRE